MLQIEQAGQAGQAEQADSAEYHYEVARVLS